MNKILPFIDFTNKKAFIKKDGEIIYIEGKHEDYVEEYIKRINDKEKILYELWMKKYNIKSNDIQEDFLVKVLSYDKVNFKADNIIVTSSLVPHMRFYNYYLMDYSINAYSKLIYNEEANDFFETSYMYGINAYQDDEYAEEIREIKGKTLLKNRYIFLK